jgi:cytochrome oxidase assembly protein ShyY1
MNRKVPILPTLIVLVAVGIMIRLGFWQIDRMHQKEAMLARFEAAQTMSAEVSFPAVFEGHAGPSGEIQFAKPKADLPGLPVYRRARLDCRKVVSINAVSGENAQGAGGLAHVATCLLGDGGYAKVVLGWSQVPTAPQWQGGPVAGTLAFGRLVADPPLAGLQPNARPDPRNLSNNHLAYAVQWFAFAAVALAIYALALRKRLHP